MSPLRLTRLGEIANRYGVMTPPEWYRSILKDVNAAADRGEDWEMMLEERIGGLIEMLDLAREFGLDGLNRAPVPPTSPHRSGEGPAPMGED